MTFDDIGYRLSDYKSQFKKIFATSSFQTQSVVLLHIISRIDATIPVYFLNTGYLFPETIKYKDLISGMMRLNIIDLRPNIPKNLQRDSQGNLLYTSDPDYCCHLNKIQPLDSILAENDVWISGIRANQSEVRKQMLVEEKAPHNVIRFHPILDWSNKMIYDYINEFNLPRHPLDEAGYVSIGCEPCTRKINLNEDERTGRWYGLKKTECGLHTELIQKK
jgi:phosphoadenosine phosphosulfate reductase